MKIKRTRTGRRDPAKFSAVLPWSNCERRGRFLAVVNPAAGGGRCRKLVGPMRLIVCERAESSWMWSKPLRQARDATSGTRRLCPRVSQVHCRGRRWHCRTRSSTDFFRGANLTNLPRWHFFPWEPATHSLREFSDRGVEHAIEALLARRSQPCDVLRLRHTRREFCTTSICWPWVLPRT